MFWPPPRGAVAPAAVRAPVVTALLGARSVQRSLPPAPLAPLAPPGSPLVQFPDAPGTWAAAGPQGPALPAAGVPDGAAGRFPDRAVGRVFAPGLPAPIHRAAPSRPAAAPPTAEQVFRMVQRIETSATSPNSQPPAAPSPDTGTQAPASTSQGSTSIPAAGQTPAAGAGIPAPSGTATPAPGPVQPGKALPDDIDELARRLYPRLRPYLRRELWHDRERAGLLTDLG